MARAEQEAFGSQWEPWEEMLLDFLGERSDTIISECCGLSSVRELWTLTHGLHFAV